MLLYPGSYLISVYYTGQIVGVVYLNQEHSPKLASLIEVTYTSRSSRELAENDNVSSPIIIARVLLVRQTLAWMTGIILLIATLLGVSARNLHNFVHLHSCLRY